MTSFILFIFIMSFTPGPNTIMAMLSGQNIGFKKSLPLNLGMAIGFSVIGIIIMLFATQVQGNQIILFLMKIIGSLYLGYLTYHVYNSKPSKNEMMILGFKNGLAVQLTNVKVYLYFITGLSAYSLTGQLGSMLSRLLLMIIMGSLGTLSWTLFGQLIENTYKKHYKIFNTVIAILLIISIIDLWR
ncbi:LysE family transporter [Leuconostoc suionicum]|uniref:LysE family transporter n=1 Tax=Leuconostoc suionicum TaxID=1511761 RepID=UPI003C45ED9B